MLVNFINDEQHGKCLLRVELVTDAKIFVQQPVKVTLAM